MPPVGVIKLAGVVVAVLEFERIVGQLIPFLAGDLAGFTADAEGCIGEEANGLCHASVPHQVWCDLVKALLNREQVKWQASELVNDRDGAFVSSQVERQQVFAAAPAAIDAHMRELFLLLEDRKLAALSFTAARAGHSREDPVVRAA